MSVVIDDTATLEREARHLHKIFFESEVPVEVISRYVAACRTCLPEADPREAAGVAEAMARGLDMEAVEFGLRLRGRTLLKNKIQVLFYLCEVRRDHLGFFFNTDETRVLAVARLLAALARSGFKAVKGIWLVKRYRLD